MAWPVAAPLTTKRKAVRSKFIDIAWLAQRSTNQCGGSLKPARADNFIIRRGAQGGQGVGPQKLLIGTGPPRGNAPPCEEKKEEANQGEGWRGDVFTKAAACTTCAS